MGDEWHCGRCGLQWGINDGDPPNCGKVEPDPLGDVCPGLGKCQDAGCPAHYTGDDPLAPARAILGD